MPANFDYVPGLMPAPGEGEMLVRNYWLSLDPYMRFLMDSGEAYSAPVQLGAVMQGHSVGRVLESRRSTFQPGDFVVGDGNWQEYCVMSAYSARKLEPDTLPLSTALGVLGLPGQTAWVGMFSRG